MYCVNKKKKIKNKKVQLLDFDGFIMTSRSNQFHIEGQNIKDVKIINRKLANPIVFNKVNKKYKKLIRLLTDLLVSDDDTGESASIVLDEIEKFRQEVKNKYRDYLNKKELELMAKQLALLQKEAKSKYLELCVDLRSVRTSSRGK